MSEDFPVPGGLAAGSRVAGYRVAGYRVAGYRVEEPLGAGGMAVVYRARDERLRRLVALKVLAPALAADDEFRRRFTAESRAAAAVDHPNIIPIYEADQAGRELFIAMGRTEPAAPTATGTRPAILSRPLTGTLAATMANSASQGVRAVAFGPGGTTLAAGDFSGNFTYLWDTATGRLTATLTGPNGRAVASGGTPAPSVNAVAFPPHSTTLATGDQNGNVYLWRISRASR